jgi:hypothetical protein
MNVKLVQRKDVLSALRVIKLQIKISNANVMMVTLKRMEYVLNVVMIVRVVIIRKHVRLV